MYSLLNIADIDEQLSQYNWSEKIIKLDNFYVFKISIVKLISSNMSKIFFHFAQHSLKLLTLKVFASLVLDRGSSQNRKWQNEITETSAHIKSTYCEIIQRLKKHKKNQIMDNLILIISLLSREFLQKFFISKKGESSSSNDKIFPNIFLKQEGFNNKNLAQATSQQYDCLQVQQYCFIILINQTTGNIVAPAAFIYLKNKIIERSIFQRRGSQQLIESLKYVKDHLSKKQVHLQRVRIVKQNSIHRYLRSALKVLQNGEYYASVKHPTNKIDAISLSLGELLKRGKENKKYHQLNEKEQEKNSGKQPKINFKSHSSAAKFYYGIVQKELPTLSRSKRSLHLFKTKPPNKYIKEIKQINKSTLLLKHKAISQYSAKQNKQQKKNWENIIDQLKKSLDKQEVPIEKFKSSSMNSANDQKLIDRPVQKSEKKIPKDNKQSIFQSVTNRRQVYIRNQIGQNSVKHGEPMRRTSLKLKKWGSCIENRLYPTYSMKEESTNDATHKLQKRVANLKNHKKAFEQKCKIRKEMIKSRGR